MYEPGHSGPAGQDALRADLRRLQTLLARHEQHLLEARSAHDLRGAELLARTASLLTEEIARVRSLLD